MNKNNTPDLPKISLHYRNSPDPNRRHAVVHVCEIMIDQPLGSALLTHRQRRLSATTHRPISLASGANVPLHNVWAWLGAITSAVQQQPCERMNASAAAGARPDNPANHIVCTGFTFYDFDLELLREESAGTSQVVQELLPERITLMRSISFGEHLAFALLFGATYESIE